MAFFEDMFKGGNIVTGLAIGIGTAVVVPLIAPAMSGVLRPAGKAVIKGGIVAYDRMREAMAQAGEAAGDMVAEARSDAHHTATTTSTATEPPLAEAHPA